MTNLEAADLLDNLIGMVSDNHDSDYDEALSKGRDILKSEPCEDCISREAVMALAKEECETAIIPYKRFVNGVNSLPPVTPKPKTGRWVNKSRRSGCGVTFVESECTCCGKKTPFNCDEFLYRYCPNCGCHMVESQESEE